MQRLYFVMTWRYFIQSRAWFPVVLAWGWFLLPSLATIQPHTLPSVWHDVDILVIPRCVTRSSIWFRPELHIHSCLKKQARFTWAAQKQGDCASLGLGGGKSFCKWIQPSAVQDHYALVVQVLMHCCEASNWVLCKNTVPNYPPYTGPQHNTAIKRVNQTLLSNASSLSENLHPPQAVKCCKNSFLATFNLKSSSDDGRGGKRRDWWKTMTSRELLGDSGELRHVAQT